MLKTHHVGFLSEFSVSIPQETRDGNPLSAVYLFNKISPKIQTRNLPVTPTFIYAHTSQAREKKRLSHKHRDYDM